MTAIILIVSIMMSFLVGMCFGVWLLESRTHTHHFNFQTHEVMLTITGSGTNVDFVVKEKDPHEN